ncbi:MAG: thiamine pyrophosphate-dependent dehydrogenase E1 component subunit alpha [Gaiellaceae bacterium]
MAKVEERIALPREQLLHFLHEMLVIRHFEQQVEEQYMAGEIPGFVHVAIGQEAVAVGACQALEPEDVMTSTHRSHAHTLAKGTPPREVMAEMYGKREGCSKGYGGSMHMYDVARGNIGSNAVVGGGLGIAAGAAFAFKQRGEARIALAFLGDGATSIGMFHESLNLAQLWKVPAVFLCENNRWAESAPFWQVVPIDDLADRAVAFGMRSMSVDGQDVAAVYQVVGEAADYARSGNGPVFVVAETYRLAPHNVGDQQKYRDKSEYDQSKATQDPIVKLKEKLDLGDDEFERIEAETLQIAVDAVEFARNGTDPGPENLFDDVYA